jgi:phytol kinase
VNILKAIPGLASIPDLWLQIGLVGLWLGGLLLLAESLNRYAGINTEITRKIVHIGTGQVILLAWWLQIPAWVAIAAAIIAGIIALLSYWLPILPGINSVGRESFGTFFYAVSIGILVGWFWPLQLPQYAVIGILVMAWGDGLAAVIGQKFGKHPYKLLGMQKSWEGSLTMALITYTVCSLILLSVQGSNWITWGVPVIVAITATGLESFSTLGIDNLTVPVGSALICFWCHQWLIQ